MAEGNGTPTVGELTRRVEKLEQGMENRRAFELRVVSMLGAVTVVSFLLGLAAGALKDAIFGK